MTMTAEPVRSLDAHYYTSPEIYRQEQASLFARTWQYAGHLSEVEKPGDYFTFEIAGQNLFCIRDRSYEIRVFHNVCQHRAHELVRESGNAKLIVCPYHAWSYELTGELRAGPNVNAVPGFDRSKICLTPARVEVLHGFIFANLDLEAEPLDAWFPGVREELGAFVPLIDRLRPLEWIEIPENCNWKVSVENYSECYHCKLNHPMFTTGVVRPETYDIRPQGYCLRHTTECQNLDQMTYLIDPEDNPFATDYSSWFLWPTFSFQVYPGQCPQHLFVAPGRARPCHRLAWLVHCGRHRLGRDPTPCGSGSRFNGRRGHSPGRIRTARPQQPWLSTGPPRRRPQGRPQLGAIDRSPAGLDARSTESSAVVLTRAIELFARGASVGTRLQHIRR